MMRGSTVWPWLEHIAWELKSRMRLPSRVTMYTPSPWLMYGTAFGQDQVKSMFLSAACLISVEDGQGKAHGMIIIVRTGMNYAPTNGVCVGIPH